MGRDPLLQPYYRETYFGEAYKKAKILRTGPDDGPYGSINGERPTPEPEPAQKKGGSFFSILRKLFCCGGDVVEAELPVFPLPGDGGVSQEPASRRRSRARSTVHGGDEIDDGAEGETGPEGRQRSTVETPAIPVTSRRGSGLEQSGDLPPVGSRSSIGTTPGDGRGYFPGTSGPLGGFQSPPPAPIGGGEGTTVSGEVQPEEESVATNGW